VKPEDPPTGGPTETKSARTRRTILEAAIDRFGRDGFRATSVAEICRDAGVSGSLAYAYFADKETLFRAALDHDAAEVINIGVLELIKNVPVEQTDWQESGFMSLVATVEDHPLTRRVLAGLEPHVTSRMLDIEALEGIRHVVAERMIAGQEAGIVRTDIDVKLVAYGVVQMWIVMIMAAIQFGLDGTERELAGITAIFQAAILTPGPSTPMAESPDPDM
jgi:AcrR family transcriptional regulator